jgi:predicted amidohydrolase
MKLAMWQTLGFAGDVDANLAALERTVSAAASVGAELLLCPECWLCGYHIGTAVAELSETRDGASAARIAAFARRYQIAIAYGYAERDGTDGRVYNAAQVIGADGSTLSHYRKTHLFGPQERDAFYPGDGFETPFTFRDFNVGLLICYDVEHPEAVRSLRLMGADLILIPAALTEAYATVPEFIVRARALENQVTLAYCNHAGVENGMSFLGRSCLVSADGSVTGSAGASEALVIADIERPSPAVIELYPYVADRRPELYSLLVQK